MIKLILTCVLTTTDAVEYAQLLTKLDNIGVTVSAPDFVDCSPHWQIRTDDETGQSITLTSTSIVSL